MLVRFHRGDNPVMGWTLVLGQSKGGRVRFVVGFACLLINRPFALVTRVGGHFAER